MLWKDQGVPFAVDAAGNFRDVSAVARGLKCGCYCADCRGPLVARKGEIRTHHFAHHDRRECRHALEASLFGMLMTLLQTPGAKLMVPPCGDRRQFVPRPEEVFNARQARAFFRTPWVIEASLISLEAAKLADRDLQQSRPDQPEIQVDGLEVHILSYRKRAEKLAEQVRTGGPAVLLLDLRKYAEIWWSVCDAHKGETLEQAMTATDVMTHWLQHEFSGRTWLHHPGLEEKKETLRQWMARNRLRRQVENPSADRSDTPPIALPPPAPFEPARKPVAEPAVARIPGQTEAPDAAVAGYVRRVKDADWISTHMAAEFSLWRDRRTRDYVVLGRPGDPIPLEIHEMLDPDEDWRAVTAAEAENFTSARQLLRESLAPYGGNHRRPAEES